MSTDRRGERRWDRRIERTLPDVPAANRYRAILEEDRSEKRVGRVLVDDDDRSSLRVGRALPEGNPVSV